MKTNLQELIGQPDGRESFCHVTMAEWNGRIDSDFRGFTPRDEVAQRDCGTNFATYLSGYLAAIHIALTSDEAEREDLRWSNVW